MKQILKLLLLLICLGFSYLAPANINRLKPDKFKEFKTEINDVKFSIDPRIELFHAVELAAGIPLVNPIELDYKQKIENHFAPYKSHPVFSFLNRNALYGKIFTSIDAPIWFLLHLTNDFDWRKDITYSDAQNLYLDSLRIHLKDLAIKSNYANFFNSNADLYNISLYTMRYNFPGFDEKNRLLKYCGVKNGKDIQFNVIINYLGWGNFGPRIFKKQGAEFYAVMAPEKSAIRVPTFDVVRLYKLLWHEFGHSFANPAVEKIESQFEPLAYLWEPIKESMKSQAYHSWMSVIKEHITEAIACRLAAEKFGEEYAELNFVRIQKGNRWIYLNPILRALKEYEANRNIYPTLDDFMPQIVAALKEVKQTDINTWMAYTEELRKPDVNTMPVSGAIYDKENILFILSSNEPDKAADLRLKNFINDFKKNIPTLAKATVVADTTALKMDVSGYNLFVWGTPTGNQFLQKHLSELPLIIKPDAIIAENEFKGTGYAILTAWVNPHNKNNIMTIYTAQNPDNLVNFNRVMNGGANYHIIRNFITMKAGSFKKAGSVWVAN
ncbi:MAG: DUF4932 domain-containing protein [Cytophagales bacterium CG18_big_fil_WC_8_21_14_2_50_42_9]|nr:MAG: DUF4932 domain-containing protein [Cytophagales bacterium CG18_big_fil_WC_8_21_14_2_50_42_9]